MTVITVVTIIIIIVAIMIIKKHSGNNTTNTYYKNTNSNQRLFNSTGEAEAATWDEAFLFLGLYDDMWVSQN